MHRTDTNTTALASAVTIAAGTLAYADPVRFDNDGSFRWTDGVFLDITRSVDAQTGQPTSEGSFEYRRIFSPCCDPLENPAIFGLTQDAQLEGYPAVSVRGLGAVVPNDFASPYGQTWDSSQALGYYYMSGAGFYTQFDKGYPSGAPGYFAARFQLDGRTHYGWLSMTLSFRLGPRPHYTFDLLAWGYETDPDTPLPAGAVPAPGGALAVLALGAVAGATRGRRT